MQRAKAGDRVTVHYIGTLDNGRIFDQRDDEHPLSFIIGAGEVFPALEQAVLGMRVGEVKNIFLPAERAYGPRSADNLLRVPRELFPAGRSLEVGQALNIELHGRVQQRMRIREISGQTVLLDGNHDLAGCDLLFALLLAAIE
jgi:FKBP-type peptidyl-prolyl cis-trans isomerase 2